MDNAKLVIEVTAAVLPPEVQMLAACGESEMHAPHVLGPTSECMGIPTQPTAFTKNRPLEELTRRYWIGSEEWHASEAQDALLAERAGEALGFAHLLMCRPDRFNHVRVEWLWF